MSETKSSLIITLKNLPPFDSSVNFGITQADENIHVREEIKKFVRFINMDKPPIFDSYGAFRETNNAGYNDLFNIVDQIRANLQVILHDNACLAFDHYVRHEFNEIFQKSRADLRARYLREPRGIVGHNPELLDDEIRNMKAHHALIDYIFHSLAWWLMHVSERKSWYAPFIAVLARWSVKLKLVALDPVRWAEHSLARGEDIMRRISEERKEGERVSIDIQPPGEHSEAKKVDTLDDRDQDFLYYMSKTRIRETLYEFIRQILSNLIAGNTRKKGSTAFEVRTLLYRNDLDQTLRQLTIQQNGDVGTSSDTANLSYSYRALQLLLSNAQNADVERELIHYDEAEASSPENLLKGAALKTFNEYKARKAEINSWSLMEDSVRVHTTKYSSITLAIALSVISGSLCVPFLVGERIPGVDPFQFVTFGWLLAGAFLVGAKSRYVENWPWHDFLRGQIVCRSVSELAVASRVKRQAVLLYLLHHEFRGPLRFRGPCQGPFHRRSNSSTEGFTIDVPVEHGTMLAAGFIVLEVRSKEMKTYTLLHDTRDIKYDMPTRKSLISDPLDDILSGNGERSKLGYKEEIRLNLDPGPVEYNVVGLLAVDCNFI
ncbi:hypothetical protein GQ53DRAFT_809771 [Thozetella sp. PMI_491]|nr:hypothetical protein GQ53DRAFT_809771 [Thozetella sp. PMI_491]